MRQPKKYVQPLQPGRGTAGPSGAREPTWQKATALTRALTSATPMARRMASLLGEMRIIGEGYS